MGEDGEGPGKGRKSVEGGEGKGEDGGMKKRRRDTYRRRGGGGRK
jgi:hypothetical protein